MLRLNWELNARGILEKRTADGIIWSEDARAEQLVVELERKLSEDPQCVGEVLEALEKSGDYGSLAQTIQNNCGQSCHQTDRPQGKHY